jgi:hypothetical protein
MMTPDKGKRRGFNWSSAIGWIIFLVIVAARPISQLLRPLFGGNLALPGNLSSLIPIAIGGLVVLAVVVAALRAIGNATRSGSPQLPTDLSRTMRPPSAPMPPFGGASPRQPTAAPSPRAFTPPPGSVPQQRLSTPRFDPLVNPLILAIGILGLLVLGGAALFLLTQGGP